MQERQEAEERDERVVLADDERAAGGGKQDARPQVHVGQEAQAVIDGLGHLQRPHGHQVLDRPQRADRCAERPAEEERCGHRHDEERQDRQRYDVGAVCQGQRHILDRPHRADAPRPPEPEVRERGQAHHPQAPARPGHQRQVRRRAQRQHQRRHVDVIEDHRPRAGRLGGRTLVAAGLELRQGELRLARLDHARAHDHQGQHRHHDRGAATTAGWHGQPGLRDLAPDPHLVPKGKGDMHPLSETRFALAGRII